LEIWQKVLTLRLNSVLESKHTYIMFMLLYRRLKFKVVVLTFPPLAKISTHNVSVEIFFNIIASWG